MPGLSYDVDKMEVRGEGFRITCVGMNYRDSRAKFLYQDNDVEFYFEAMRTKWIKFPTADKAGETVDTETYDIRRLWCINASCVHQKTDIEPKVKERAKKNILAGMMFMEDYVHKPPKNVIISND